jgi:hypothetical protein
VALVDSAIAEERDMTTAAISLAGGSGIFLAFMIVFFFAIVYGYYTRRGSGINQRSYERRYGSAPGAKSPSVLSHDRNSAYYFTRGTK